MGIFYAAEKPSEGFSPKPMDLPTREKEMKRVRQRCHMASALLIKRKE
jgi:hypothetical protein